MLRCAYKFFFLDAIRQYIHIPYTLLLVDGKGPWFTVGI